MRFLIGLAILPPFLLMWYIRRLDRIESEPVDLLVQLALFGGLTTISAALFEFMGTLLLGVLWPEESILRNAVMYFIVVACSEELGKFLVLGLRTWRSLEFNYTYDGVVYAVAASLGFAVVENVLFVLTGGVETAIMRAITAIPGHTIFGIYMGFYFARARRADADGDSKGTWGNLAKAFVVPVLIHGTYDFLLTLEGALSVVLFLAFYVALLIFAFFRVKKLAREDTSIYSIPFDEAPPPEEPDDWWRSKYS